jgi:arylamine N-acetyltransferase
MDLTLQAAYLARLGLEVEPPSVAALQRLHRRQVERIPYETLWIHGGEQWGIDPAESVRRIAVGGRGGYCYHLNGAFALLLQSLGYDVHLHVGGVHGPTGPDSDSVANHLVLTVRDLPTDEHPDGVWYVDAGLGDALHEALPLATGEYRQGPFLLTLSDDGGGGWHLQHDPNGGFVGMGWTMVEADWSDFSAKHHWLSTSPESGFVRIGMAEHRDATGVDVVRGLIVSRIGSDARTEEPITDRAGWFDALGELLGLRFDSTPPEVPDQLWSRTLSNHRAWETAGGP